MSALLSAGAYLAALWLCGVVPVQVWADARRVENLARNYYPEMDPGVAVLLVCFLLVPFALSNVAIEAVRLFRKGVPLSLPGSLLLGGLAGAPLAYAVVAAASPTSYVTNFMVFALATACFYGVRALWLRRARLAAA